MKRLSHNPRDHILWLSDSPPDHTKRLPGNPQDKVRRLSDNHGINQSEEIIADISHMIAHFFVMQSATFMLSEPIIPVRCNIPLDCPSSNKVSTRQ